VTTGGALLDFVFASKEKLVRDVKMEDSQSEGPQQTGEMGQQESHEVQ